MKDVNYYLCAIASCLKLVSVGENWELANGVKWSQCFKKGIQAVLLCSYRIEMFPSCCSCLSPNSCGCNLLFGCINTTLEESSLMESFQ